jgi:hypothetical protein
VTSPVPVVSVVAFTPLAYFMCGPFVVVLPDDYAPGHGAVQGDSKITLL